MPHLGSSNFLRKLALLWTGTPSRLCFLNYALHCYPLVGNESYLAIEETDDSIDLWFSSMWNNIYSTGPVKFNWKSKAFLRYFICLCIHKALGCKVIETAWISPKKGMGQGFPGHKIQEGCVKPYEGKVGMQLSLWNNGNQGPESCQNFLLLHLESLFLYVPPLLGVAQPSLPGGYLTIYKSFILLF